MIWLIVLYLSYIWVKKEFVLYFLWKCPINPIMMSYYWAKMSCISSKNCPIILYFFRQKSRGYPDPSMPQRSHSCKSRICRSINFVEQEEKYFPKVIRARVARQLLVLKLGRICLDIATPTWLILSPQPLTGKVYTWICNVYCRTFWIFNFYGFRRIYYGYIDYFVIRNKDLYRLINLYKSLLGHSK